MKLKTSFWDPQQHKRRLVELNVPNVLHGHRTGRVEAQTEPIDPWVVLRTRDGAGPDLCAGQKDLDDIYRFG
ncbi:hypothetical protein BC938DRAFT_472436 [Jimgerdemannia flammicorona]|uniref:Uncharacterized protein n=1 Tax=Jimgerdemannia flammicorona TaxID=994334 RepID=A0A433Q647_9FUNG|nr:hypothetical protein BC938DRAFT_472436 [Jimgerdemannia flammicorona]